MKGLADRLQVVVFDIRMAHDQTFLLALINHRQHAVVGRDKILILGADKQRAAFGSHTGIYNHDVDCFRRKVGIRRANRQGSVASIKSNAVTLCVMSTMVTSGLIFRITPFSVPTRWSLVP